jgi:hypothetical protein
MPYSLFHSRFPEVAERETRTITVVDPSQFNLPSAHYSFLKRLGVVLTGTKTIVFDKIVSSVSCYPLKTVITSALRRIAPPSFLKYPFLTTERMVSFSISGSSRVSTTLQNAIRALLSGNSIGTI